MAKGHNLINCSMGNLNLTLKLPYLKNNRISIDLDAGKLLGSLDKELPKSFT
jgi:hypothetical protein